MKRKYPLFVIYNNRQHKLGECDFIVCTDRDNAFVAICDYIEEEKEEVGDDYRIGIPTNGLSLRIKIQNQYGLNPSVAQTRSLLKQAMKKYSELSQPAIDIDKPSRQECVQFLNTLIDGSMHNIHMAKGYNERLTVLKSIAMLQYIREYLVE